MLSLSTRFEVRRYGTAVERHVHDGHHQLVLPMRGVLEMEIGGRSDEVADGRAGIVARRLGHSFAGSPGNSFLVLDLPVAAPSAAGLDRFWAAVAEQPFVPVPTALRGFCEVVASAAGEAAWQGIRADVAGELVVGALARCMGIETEPAARALSRALAFIDGREGEALSVAAIAGAAGLSESRLHALFREHLGVAPGRYVAQRRLRRAALLLEGTAEPVARIAYALGYGDQSAFTRAFRRETGQSPAAYRRARQDRHKEG